MEITGTDRLPKNKGRGVGGEKRGSNVGGGYYEPRTTKTAAAARSLSRGSFLAVTAKATFLIPVLEYLGGRKLLPEKEK